MVSHLISLLFVWLVPCNTAAYDVRPHKPAVASIRQGEYIPLPDSLGGKTARGDVILNVYLHKSGVALGYEVRRVSVVRDPCQLPDFYGVGAPSLPEGKKRGTIRGEKILERYRGWIEESYRNLHIEIDTTHPDFFRSDTSSWSYTIEINPELEARIDSAARDFYYEVPVFPFPDSLGGKKMKGWIAVRAYLDSLGRILCWVPQWIRAENNVTGIGISFSDHSLNPGDDDTVAKRFSSWTRGYLSRVRFNVRKNDPIFKEMQGIPVDVYLKINAKNKVRRTTDIGFLFDEGIGN